MIRAAASLVVLLIIAAGNAAGGQKREVPEKVRTAITTLNNEMARAALEGKFDLQRAHFTDDAIFDHPLEPPIRGMAAIREATRRMVREGVRYQSFSTTTEEMWLSEGRVYERGTWGMSATSTGRKQPTAAYGSYFQIWREMQSGTFKIEYLIFTLDFNPFEAGR